MRKFLICSILSVLVAISAYLVKGENHNIDSLRFVEMSDKNYLVANDSLINTDKIREIKVSDNNQSYIVERDSNYILYLKQSDFNSLVESNYLAQSSH